ncbi:glycosyltransferase family 2 protein [Haloferax massiliensis]|uniref:glycosyltransferase family 2 protein n=1 Tax=Haloferax massiliensis TaxID=1476858 RepID=UPI0014289BC0|nr:glycosyltransferase family 2 protein [Haloferax massiliensis]
MLNWNNFEDTRDCVDSLQKISYKNHDIVIVDNGSTDDSLLRLQNTFPEVVFVELDRNRGFSGGMNAGISWAVDHGADFTWILNNDVVIEDFSILEKLLPYFEMESVGCITPQVFEYPDKETEWFTKGELDRGSGHSTHHKCISEKPEQFVENEYLPLCSTLISTDVFDEYGLLPERYFIYREDVAFAYDISEKFRMLTILNCRVYHKSSNSSGGDLNRTLTYYTARNRWLLYYKYNHEMSIFLFVWQYLNWVFVQFLMVMKSQNIDGLIGLTQGTVDGILNKQGRGRYP